jgi:phosphoribosylformylglycinamidine cyclo-ligase
MKQHKSAYKEAGVDINAGYSLVNRIKPLISKTKRPGVIGGIGGFGALFDLKKIDYQDPLLVSATDGVGTKLKIAVESGKHDTVGIDLVAMCVNDIVVQGAEPLFFLDYFASGKLDVDVTESVIKGIAKGCEIAGCALVGGETAEMPGMYKEGDYDLAGFCVGAVERNKIIQVESVQEGDVVLGLASSGLHSNGFSLVRKIIRDKGFSYLEPCSFQASETIGEALLEPTRIYTKSILSILRENHEIKSFANITGGGLIENLPRALPDNVKAQIDLSKVALPEVFSWLKDLGRLSVSDLLESFNCGIGMAVVCSLKDSENVKSDFAALGETVFDIGKIATRSQVEEAIEIVGHENW